MNSNTLASRGLRLLEPMLPGLGAAREPIDPQHPPRPTSGGAVLVQLLTHRRKNFGGLNDY